jgi:hypothetical protein
MDLFLHHFLDCFFPNQILGILKDQYRRAVVEALIDIHMELVGAVRGSLGEEALIVGVRNIKGKGREEGLFVQFCRL